MIKMFAFFRNNRYKTLWAAFAACSGAIPIVLVSFFIFHYIGNRVEEDTRRFAINISNSLPSLLTDDFAYLDYAGITSKLSRLQKDTGLKTVRALDANRQIIFDTDSLSARDPNRIKEPWNSIKICTPINGKDGSAFGYVEFVLSLEKSFEFKKKMFWAVLGGACLSSFSVFVLILIAISRLLKPYSRIFDSMTLVAQGKAVSMDDYLNLTD